MKRIGMLMACALAFACVCIVAGCSGGPGAGTVEFEGLWTSDRAGAEAANKAAASSGEGASAGQADGASGSAATAEGAEPGAEPAPLVYANLALQPDGKAVLLLDGNQFEGTWAKDGGGAKLVIEGVLPIELKAESDHLVMSQDGMQVSLWKIDAAEGALGVSAGGAAAIEDMAPVAVADDDKVAISVTGKGLDPYGDPCFRLSVANKTDKPLLVRAADIFRVGGVDVPMGWIAYVEPGASADEEYLYFASDPALDPSRLENVTGSIIASNAETDEQVATYEFRM